METTELQTQALTVLDQAKAMPAVTTDTAYAQAGEFIMAGKQLIAKITAAHKPSIDAAHQAHKAAIALRDSHIEPINAALAIVQPLALAYKQEQDRKAAAEAARIAEEQRKAREEAAIKDAEFLEAWGDQDGADAVIAKATAPTRIVPVAPAVPKVAGLYTRKVWKARVVNRMAVNRQYCEPALTLINAKVANAFYKISQVTPEMVKAMEDEIGGVVLEEVETFAGRKINS